MKTASILTLGLFAALSTSFAAEEEAATPFVWSRATLDLVASGDAEGAKPIYEENYNRAPDDPAANRNYAEILVLTKRYPEAIEMITRIKDSFPDTDAAKGIDDLSKKIEDAKKAEAEAEKKEAEGDGKTENGDVKIPSEITAPTKEETPAPRAE